MENRQSTLLEKLFEELKAGNPLFFVAALFIIVLMSSLWVWQTVNSPRSTPTPRFSHPTSAARIKTLTAQAPQASATPEAVVPVSTPLAAFFLSEKNIQFWVDGVNPPGSFSR